MARNYSCGFNNLLCGANVIIYTSQFSNGTVADFATITPLTCTSGSVNACNGQQTGSGGNFSTSWTSGAPSVASISGSNAVSNVYLQGNAPGSSGVGAQIRSVYCSTGGGGTANVVPTPQIFFSGNDVSFKTLDGLIGIQVPLTASITLPPGLTATKTNWIIPDAAVGGYSLSQSGASYTPVVKNPTSTTFYWTKGGVQTVTYQVTLNTGVTTSASVTFNVIVPTVTATAQLTAPVSVVFNAPYSMLELGSSSTDGIRFNVSLVANAGTAASYSWVQLLSSASHNYKCQGGSFKSRTVTTGLDTVYPYANPGVLTTTDRPSTSLNNALHEIQLSEAFTMYLMFDAGPSRSTPTNTIPISLGYFNWNWSGDAVQSGTSGSWSLQANPTSSVSQFNLGGLAAYLGAQHCFLRRGHMPIIKSRRFTFLTYVLVSLLPELRSFAQTKAAQSPIAITINQETKQCRVGKPCTIRVALANVSKDPVRVSITRGEYAVFSDYKVHVMYMNGTPVTQRNPFEPGNGVIVDPYQNHRMVDFSPGETSSDSFLLGEAANIRKPGVYSVQLSRDNKLLGAPWTASSNVLSIRYTK